MPKNAARNTMLREENNSLREKLSAFTAVVKLSAFTAVVSAPSPLPVKRVLSHPPSPQDWSCGEFGHLNYAGRQRWHRSCRPLKQTSRQCVMPFPSPMGEWNGQSRLSMAPWTPQQHWSEILTKDSENVHTLHTANAEHILCIPHKTASH